MKRARGAATEVAKALEGFAVVVDWQHKEDVQRQMRRAIKDRLRSLGIDPAKMEVATAKGHGRGAGEAGSVTLEAAHNLDFGGELLSFVIERTARRKTVAISVGYDGVRVLAPADLDDGRVISIVRKKGAWLLRKQAGYRELGGSPIVREFVSGETFHYLGRPYRLKVIPDDTAVDTRISARGSTLVAPVPLQAPPLIRRVAVRSGLRLWYREQAKTHFPRPCPPHGGSARHPDAVRACGGSIETLGELRRSRPYPAELAFGHGSDVARGLRYRSRGLPRP